MYRVRRKTFVEFNQKQDYINQALEEQCQGDLLMKLFKKPESCVNILFEQLCKLIEKKLSPELKRSSMYMDLHKQGCNTVCKTFFILMIIAREEEAQQVILDAYNEQTSLWREKSAQRFQTSYIPGLQALFDRAFHEHFGEVNTVQILHFYVNEAQRMYMSFTG